MKQLTSINYFNQQEYLNNYLVYKLFQGFLETNEKFYSKQFGGLVENIAAFLDELEEVSNFKKVTEREEEDDKTIIYFSDDSYLSIYVPNTKKITVEFICGKKQLFESICIFLGSKFQEIQKEKQIHMIAPDEYTEQVSLYPMGNVSSPLNRNNYEEETLKKVDYIISELNSENPTGRMVLIDGFPGTGKSYLIRGILNELNYGICVLVPVSMLEGLDKPNLIPLLMKNKSAKSVNSIPGMRNLNESKGKSLILIIEDADSVLAPRAADNMSAISSLLNYTDGIFGTLFDLRIIATTNASHVEIEKALLRPGRLLKRIHVGLLTPEKASEIYKNITGKERIFEKEVSLATVYSLARGNEIEEEVSNDHQSVGF